ncbi:MAG TPA: GNAT family N-acetyltransferase, partial [Candidatus Kapabacteria bacterium]|nr:GNAT family N-acetyltransferase [Candidatus Kapabacteria bacterium]
LLSDAEAVFEMESDPEVMRYMHSGVTRTLEDAQETISNIRRRYSEDGIGRWVVIEKNSGDFIGISGLRIVDELRNGHENYHSLGYRFIKRYWGNGYATEAAKAALQHGFETMELSDIYAVAMPENIASRAVLEKCGLRFVNEFDYHGRQETWYEISKADWLKLQPKP